jgi:putative transposase
MRYRSIKDDTYLMEKLQHLAADHPREGFWKCHFRIRNGGDIVNHKRLHRIYQQMGLPLRRKHKKRLPARVKEPLEVPAVFTHTWSIDFMSDATTGARKFRTFNVIDDYNREVLFIETDYSLKSSRVIWVLRHLVNRYGKPSRIRMDNGPELIANLARSWSEAHGIEFKYIQPGKPAQNAYIERFNRSFREGVLDSYLFDNLEQVREAAAKWVEDYNMMRPHEALGNISPANYREKNDEKQNTSPALRSASATPSLHFVRGKCSKQPITN